mmetsp:Transcript_23098/g.64045  ORF Transcript_23098/g.64045 Transcript_23098/m.64045 type:complete len:359 (-) Transcript_23098:1723-2799(-)
MNNPSQQKTQDQVRERREEQLLFQRFQKVATVKLEKLSRNFQTPKRAKDGNGANGGFNVDVVENEDDDLKFGEEEQKILSDLTGIGLKEGILASIASFIVLRRGPTYIGRWIQRRNKNLQSSSSFSSSSVPGGNSPYQLSDPTKFKNAIVNNPFHRASNPNQNNFPRPRGLLSRSIWFLFDSVLSLMVGANVSMAFTDKDEIRQQIVDLPLVSGRSLTADSLCDEIVEELRKVREEKNPTFERLQKMRRGQDSASTEGTAASYYLDGIILFCQNCERRRYFERRIREESGLAKTVPVKIPVPGVPRDGPRLVKLDGEEEKVVDKDGVEDPFGDQFSNTTSWAHSFVSDQNNSDRGRGL